MDDNTKNILYPKGSIFRILKDDIISAEFKIAKGAIAEAVSDVSGGRGDAHLVRHVARAREIGSDLIVVGRPITAAEDPVAAYRRCVAEFVG